MSEAILNLDAMPLDRPPPSAEEVLAVLGKAFSVLDEFIAPGTFGGDVMLVWKGDQSGQDEALNRLMRYFPRGVVFHSQRWELLREHYRRYCEEAGYSPQNGEAWHSLGRPALFAAIRDAPDDKPIGEYPHFLRREARKEIERTLLDGETLDEHLGRGGVPMPEEETPEALALESRLIQELGELAEIRVDVLRALTPLTPAEREAIKTAGGDNATCASRYRAMKKLKKLRG